MLFLILRRVRYRDGRGASRSTAHSSSSTRYACNSAVLSAVCSVCASDLDEHTAAKSDGRDIGPGTSSAASGPMRRRSSISRGRV